MTLTPETKTFRLIVWTCDPVRKFTFAEPVAERDLLEMQAIIGQQNSKVYGFLKSGHYLILPGRNIAYFEAVPL
jgi:hypothetical protein